MWKARIHCASTSRVSSTNRTPARGESARTEAGLLLDLLTPVVKSWPSQWCLEANSLAIQIHGGYGYTCEYPVEQFYRDNRLNMIHEGTHGIQAIALLGRKVVMKRCAALGLLAREIEQTVQAARAQSAHGALHAHADALEHAWRDIMTTVEALLPTLQSDAERALANASSFLESFGHVVIAWMWLRQVNVANAALTSAVSAAVNATRSEADEDFYRGKLHACQ